MTLSLRRMDTATLVGVFSSKSNCESIDHSMFLLIRVIYHIVKLTYFCFLFHDLFFIVVA